MNTDSPVSVAVLSDQSKRSMYDAGLYDPLEEEDQVRTYYIVSLIYILRQSSSHTVNKAR